MRLEGNSGEEKKTRYKTRFDELLTLGKEDAEKVANGVSLH